MHESLTLLLDIVLVMAPFAVLFFKKLSIRSRLLIVSIAQVFTFCAYVAVSLWVYSEMSPWVYIYLFLVLLTIVLSLLLILFSWMYDRSGIHETIKK
jgi:apolipoprotein N-acyltransferase